MVTVFTDNFNRANGPIGAPWIPGGSSCQIVSNEAQLSNGSSITYQESISSSNHSVQCKLQLYAHLTNKFIISVGIDMGTNYRTEVRLRNATSYIEILMFSVTSGTYQIGIAGAPIPAFNPSGIARFVATGRFRLLYIDDVLACAGYDAYNAGGTGVRFYASGGTFAFDDVEVCDLGTSTFAVTPTAITNLGDPVTLTLTNTQSNWVPGTPGSPIFTTSGGTITSQTVNTPNTATVDFQPSNVRAQYQIVDGTNGLEYIVSVGGTPTPDGGNNQGGNSDYDVALQGAGVSPSIWAELILALIQMFPTDNEPVNDAIAYAVGAKGENPPIVDTALQIYDQGTNVLQELQYGGQPAYTAREEIRAGKNAAIDANAGVSAIRTEQGHTLQTVLDAIAGIAGADLQPVLDELAAIRTPFLYTFSDVTQPLVRVESALATQSDAIGVVNLIVTAIANSLAAWRTGNLYTAQHILDAIAGIPPADLSSVLDAIRTHDADIKASLAAIRTVDNLTLGSVVTSVLDARGTGLPTIKNVLDAVNGLVIPTPEVSIPGMPPVWPGLANVTLGQAVAIDRQMDVAGPMHGLLIQLSAVPARAGRKLWGVTESYYQVGNLSFYNDNGYYEYPQKLIMQEQVITCHYFTSAAGCAIITREGTTGTVRPWTINPS